VWRRLVDWPSGNVAWHPVLRADNRCAGLGCRLAAGRDPAVRVGWRHGRTASIGADAWSPERIAGNSKRFRFCFQLRDRSIRGRIPLVVRSSSWLTHPAAMVKPQPEAPA
jgi:hypothetical protein